MGKRKQQLGDVPMDGTRPPVDDETDEVSLHLALYTALHPDSA